MKVIKIAVTLIFVFQMKLKAQNSSGIGQFQKYYYYKNEKVPLNINKSMLTVYYYENDTFENVLNNSFKWTKYKY